ncbi:putative membrane protein [Wickerhamomyces ciferrii]|uniref:Membrane protein n=1 Tax=Wickerhamomyces ciferrii (strain ATCC 14091 / BCRC 22168 / CBS 111 / JCM 3599 / NBRC 0793 / NRRL Y-1031 F-60-10) TaxID=1206466 RepID=K0KXZ7_WICCF|nr:uncharacterized protein BN7_5911 [Wickerhamomyces ciferrii]CCH46319.1 putative membrane protein [Wickerhamomyces ciferrii]
MSYRALNQLEPNSNNNKMVSKFTKIYRATYTQAHIIGFVSFTQPGIWSAIANLGAGGLQSVNTANIANAILFGIMFVTAPLYAILINKIGLKLILAWGTLGYVFWSAGLYQNSKDGTEWLIMFGAVTCGISASALWSSEATVAILYPDDNQRGKFVGTWQLWNKVGGLISGAITVALNFRNGSAGGVSLNTYIVLIALQCLGLPVSLLLSSPDKLIRKDGKKLKSNLTQESWKSRFKTLWRVFLTKEVLCLTPLFISNVWFNTWQSNYMTHHFSVRTRALNSLLTALINGGTDVVAGILLDIKMRRSIKVRISWAITASILVGFFIYSLVIQHEFDINPEEGIDWKGNPRYARSFIPFQIFKIGGELVFNWVYWVIGAYHFPPSDIPYVSGIIRSFESLGQCLGFVVGTVNTNDMTNLAVAAGVFFLSIPSTTYIAWQVDDEPVEKDKLESETEGSLHSENEDHAESGEVLDQSSKNNLIERVNTLSD